MPCQSFSPNPCFCHYNLEQNSNVYNCSSSPVKELAPDIPAGTDWLVMENDQLTELSGSHNYLGKIWSLDLRKNKIETISEFFIEQLEKGKSVKWFNLAENSLTRIPSKIQSLNFLQKVKLHGNPFHCDCDMTWMIGWLNNFTLPSREHVIVDYKQLKCQSGMMVGKPMYKLDKVEMGCFPPELTLWQKIVIAVAALVAGIIIITLIVLVIKRSRDIKFFLYYYCKWCTCFGVPRDDKNEKLDNMEYDAYLSYR